jgi:hypothetical protein
VPQFPLGEEKANMVGSAMEFKSCKVSLRDREGVEHSVQVTAGTLYEAVALGLKTLRHTEWVEDLPEGEIQVAVQNVPVSHTVKFMAFKKWLEQRGRSPVGIIRRQKVRAILEIPEPTVYKY